MDKMAFRFTAAIEEIEQARKFEEHAKPKMEKWLLEHATDIAALVMPDLLKNLSVGDVHVPTALGNDKKKKPVSTAYEQAGERDPDELEEFRRDRTRKLLDDALSDDWSVELRVTKTDADQQIVYGWASVVEEDGRYVVDKQDDVILPEDLQKAAEEFVLYSRSQGDMHARKSVGRLIASLVTTKEIQKAFGMTLAHDRVGWIVGFKVDDDETWNAIKEGRRPEFSIGGKGKREELPERLSLSLKQ